MACRRRILPGAVLLGATVLLGPAAARGAVTDPTASRVPVTISADSVDVSALTYHGTVSIQTAAGSTTALELELDDATFHGLALDLPCVPISLGGLTGSTAVDGVTTTPVVTIYATDVAATIGGTRVRISSTDPGYPPPAADTTIVADGSLVDPVLVSVLASAPSLHSAALRTSAAFCSPGGGTAPVGGVPLSSATPEATPQPVPDTPSSPTQQPEVTDSPTPSDPTPSDPTPSSPTPSSPTPSDPTQSDPTPSSPAPSDPTPSP